MHKTAKRSRSKYDLNDDVEKIKAILADTAYDVKGRAGEMLNQSYEDVKDKTLSWKHNIEEYAHYKPFKTMGATFFLGLLMGYLLKK